MKLTLAEPKYLKESINIISDLVNEARFKISPNGVELIAMDPANVAMVIYRLLAGAFVEYDLKENTELCLNLESLKQILRRAKPNDAITLEMPDESKIQITMKSQTTRKFSLPIIDLEDKEQKVPELAFPVIVETTPTTISEAIEDVSVVSEALTLACEPQKLIISGEGDFSKANIEIPGDETTSITNDNTDPVKAKYSIEYLKKMIAGGKLADTVKLCFDSNYPLKVEFTQVDKVQLSFILAPRVENN